MLRRRLWTGSPDSLCWDHNSAQRGVREEEERVRNSTPRSMAFFRCQLFEDAVVSLLGEV